MNDRFALDAVLLSPAFASFDMFKNYEHRAEVFLMRCKHCNRRNCEA